MKHKLVKSKYIKLITPILLTLTTSIGIANVVVSLQKPNLANNNLVNNIVKQKLDSQDTIIKLPSTIDALNNNSLFKQIFDNDKGFSSDWHYQKDNLMLHQKQFLDYVNNVNNKVFVNFDNRQSVASNCQMDWIDENQIKISLTYDGYKQHNWVNNLTSEFILILKANPQLNDPVLADFGPYLQNRINSYGNLVPELVDKYMVNYLNQPSVSENLPNAWIPPGGFSVDNSTVAADNYRRKWKWDYPIKMTPKDDLVNADLPLSEYRISFPTGSLVFRTDPYDKSTYHYFPDFNNLTVPSFYFNGFNFDLTDPNIKSKLTQTDLLNFYPSEITNDVSRKQAFEDWFLAHQLDPNNNQPIYDNRTVWFTNYEDHPQRKPIEIVDLISDDLYGTIDVVLNIYDAAILFTTKSYYNVHIKLSGFKYYDATTTLNINNFKWDEQMYANIFGKQDNGYTIDWINYRDKYQQILLSYIENNKQTLFSDLHPSTTVQKVEINFNDNTANINVYYSGYQHRVYTQNILSSFQIDLRPTPGSPQSSDTDRHINPLVDINQYLQQQIDLNNHTFGNESTFKQWVCNYLTSVKDELPISCLPTSQEFGLDYVNINYAMFKVDKHITSNRASITTNSNPIMSFPRINVDAYITQYINNELNADETIKYLDINQLCDDYTNGVDNKDKQLIISFINQHLIDLFINLVDQSQIEIKQIKLGSSNQLIISFNLDKAYTLKGMIPSNQYDLYINGFTKLDEVKPPVDQPIPPINNQPSYPSDEMNKPVQVNDTPIFIAICLCGIFATLIVVLLILWLIRYLKNQKEARIYKLTNPGSN